MCLRAADRYVACTTHLALNASIAFAQCGYLLGTTVPSFRLGDTEPVGAVVSGDFNLVHDGGSGLRGCMPLGYLSKTDGGLQHLLVTAGFTVRASARIDMAGTTDHPALLVTVITATRG